MPNMNESAAHISAALSAVHMRWRAYGAHLAWRIWPVTFVGWLLALWLSFAPALAQQAASSGSTVPTTMEAAKVDAALGGAIDEAKAVAGRAERVAADVGRELARLRLQTERPDVDEARLSDLRKRLAEMNLRLLEARKQLAAPLAHMRQQLAALGPAPKDGKEEASIASRRKLLGAVVERLEAADRQLELLIGEVRHLSERAAERQRSLFFSQVLQPSRSVLNPALWLQALALVPDFASRLFSLLGSWLRGDAERAGVLVAMGLLLAALAITLLAWSRWRGPWEAGRRPTDEVRRMWQAIRVPLVVAAVTFALLALIKLALFTFGAPSPQMERALLALAGGIMYTAALIALARGIFRPRTPHMRLVNLADDAAVRAYRLASALAVLHGLDLFMVRMAANLFMPTDFAVGWSAAMALAHLVLAYSFIVTIRRGTPLTQQEGEGAAHFLFGWTRYVFHLALLALLVILLALMFGYVALAHFVARQMMFTAALASALYLLHEMADALVRAAFDSRSPVGRYLRQNLVASERGITRLGVAFSTLVDIATMLVGLPLILSQWAVNWVDLVTRAQQLFFGFRVGNITIEPANILLGLVVFVIGLVLVRLLVLWLDRRVLSRSDLDDGIRHSLLTVSRYTGIVGAFLVGLSVAGVNLTSLAFFGGALGIGIGFGLQTIVNNFVSGLILLAERPIKTGDWIQVAGGEGVVKRIKVRSTEIETFDRCTIIIPNSQLISDPVSNWFHDNRMGRVRVPVGVSYDADPEQVKEILLKCAREHPRALTSPAPFVLFTGYGDNSLDFELRLYISDAGYRASTASDLRFAIFRELKKAGIEIPFPQRDVHVRSLPPEVFDRRSGET